jgi:hypothetical protein
MGKRILWETGFPVQSLVMKYSMSSILIPALRGLLLNLPKRGVHA